MSGTTNKQLEKADSLVIIFEKYERSNLSIREFCKREGIHTSKFFYWKKRFHQHGKMGLLDKRQGTTHKVIGSIENYIQTVKIKDPSKSASDISILIEKKFKIKVSVRQIQRTLKKLKLNDPVGRKPGKTFKKTSY
jgi:transposase